MSVYVDDMRARHRGLVMCHMWADTDAELLAMADRIGVARKWIQGHSTLSHGRHKLAQWVHFDIATSKRTLAIRFGAIETDRYGPTEHVTRLKMRTALIAGDLGAVRACQRHLNHISEKRKGVRCEP